jgi:hypothetical protein
MFRVDLSYYRIELFDVWHNILADARSLPGARLQVMTMFHGQGSICPARQLGLNFSDLCSPDILQAGDQVELDLLVSA